MAVSPLSKKPPTKPASMITGCSRSARQTPRSPTSACCPSGSDGSGGISRLQSRPSVISASAAQSASGRVGPIQASSIGPATKVLPTMVSKMPIQRPR